MAAAGLAAPAAPASEESRGQDDKNVADKSQGTELEEALAAREAAGEQQGAAVERQAQEESAVQLVAEDAVPMEAAQKDAGPPTNAGQQADAAAAGQAAEKQESLDVAIGAEDLIKAADSQRVVWARVKGFPHWPAQVMTEKEADLRLEGVHRPSPLSVPVMFFGTLEIAWIAPNEIVSWADGVKAQYLKKNKNRRKFSISVQQAQEFLAPGPVRRKAPEGWWKKAINPPKPKLKETVLEIGAPASHSQPARPGSTKGAKAGSKAADALGVQEDGKLVKRAQRPVKRIDGADEDEIKALLGEEAEAELTAVPRRRSSASIPAPRPPHYEQLRRNLWVSRARPKRLPKDDIPVCVCRPPTPSAAAVVPPTSPALHSRPSSAAAAPPAEPLPLPSTAARDAEPNRSSSAPAVGPEARSEAAGAPAAAEQPQGGAEHVPQEPLSESDGALAAAAVEAAGEGGPSAAAAETHAPIAVPGPSAVSVPPAATAAAAKAAMPERTGCTENCLNRLSYIHCDPKQCPCGEYCSNRPFHMLPMPKTELYLTEHCGWGVKALEPIPRGAFIVEYAGEVVDDQECRRRMAQAKDNGQKDFYMMELAPGLIIDARLKGNMARFINSSCAPNCESQKWHDAATGEIRIGIFAAEDIEPGTELAYDYQFQHAGLAQDAGAYRCMCGAPNCRGTMDTQPERFKDFGKRVEVFWDGDSVFYRGTVTAYSVTTGKHTILYDDNDVERVCLRTVQHRWLDESAPMKLSPLREALAHNGLLGPEPLDLNAGPEAQTAALSQPLSDTPMGLPAEAGALANGTAAVQAARAAAVKVPSRRVRQPGKSRKRKQVEEEGEEAVKEEQDGPAAKRNMLLKRCQDKDTQMQQPTAQLPVAAAAFPAPSMPGSAAAVQAYLAANAGAALPPATQPVQLLPPFNVPPFAVPPIPLAPMPAGLQQNQMQAAMYQMLLLSNPQLMQARIASGHKPPEGTALPPPPTMASLQQVFATIANIASNATTMHPNLLYPSGAGTQGLGGSQALPPLAPLQLGPMTPAAAAAAGPNHLPPQQPMTPNFWGVAPPNHLPQMPPGWPLPAAMAVPAAALVPQPTAAASAAASAPTQAPASTPAPVPMQAAAAKDGEAGSASCPVVQASQPPEAQAPAEQRDQEGATNDVTPTAGAGVGGAEHTAADERHLPRDSAAAVGDEPGAAAHEQRAAEAMPAQQASSAPDISQPNAQEQEDAAAEANLGEAAAEEAAAPVTATDASASPPLPEQLAGKVQEQAGGAASADAQAQAPSADEPTAESPKAILGAAVPAAEPGTAHVDPASSHAQEHSKVSAANATISGEAVPQGSLTAEPAEAGQQAPGHQTQLAAEAESALIGNVVEATASNPAIEGSAEGSKQQSHLAAQASAALVGDVRLANGGGSVHSAEAAGASAELLHVHGNGAALLNKSSDRHIAGKVQHDPQGSQLAGPHQPTIAASTQLQQAQKSQRLFDPTAALGNSSPPVCTNGPATPAPSGLIDPMLPGGGAGAGDAPGDAAAVLRAGGADGDADEAELWGSLLVDSPSPCKVPRALWTQDPSLWRPNGSGPAPPSLG